MFIAKLNRTVILITPKFFKPFPKQKLIIFLIPQIAGIISSHVPRVDILFFQTVTDAKAFFACPRIPSHRPSAKLHQIPSPLIDSVNRLGFYVFFCTIPLHAAQKSPTAKALR